MPPGWATWAGRRPSTATPTSTPTPSSVRARSRARWPPPAPAWPGGAGGGKVEGVMKGREPNALCLVRPPGHHATPARSMGFCLFNNIALAARHAVKAHGLTRVLIVDWDVHHGNGTQDVFYEDPAVRFL